MWTINKAVFFPGFVWCVCPSEFWLTIKYLYQVFSSKAGFEGVWDICINFNKANPVELGLFLTGAAAPWEAGSTVVFQVGNAPQMKKLA